MQQAEEEDFHDLWIEHIHWPSIAEARTYALALRHHLYHYMHAAAHFAYLAFGFLEGHGFEAWCCGALFILTSYGIMKGIDTV